MNEAIPDILLDDLVAKVDKLLSPLDVASSSVSETGDSASNFSFPLPQRTGHEDTESLRSRTAIGKSSDTKVQKVVRLAVDDFQDDSASEQPPTFNQVDVTRFRGNLENGNSFRTGPGDSTDEEEAALLLDDRMAANECFSPAGRAWFSNAQLMLEQPQGFGDSCELSSPSEDGLAPDRDSAGSSLDELDCDSPFLQMTNLPEQTPSTTGSASSHLVVRGSWSNVVSASDITNSFAGSSNSSFSPGPILPLNVDLRFGLEAGSKESPASHDISLPPSTSIDLFNSPLISLNPRGAPIPIQPSASSVANSTPRSMRLEHTPPATALDSLSNSTISLDARGAPMPTQPSTSSVASSGPRLRRLEYVRAERAQKKLAETSEPPQETERTFQPQISSLASQLRRPHTSGPPPAPSRPLASQRKASWIVEQKAKEEAECTFKPTKYTSNYRPAKAAIPNAKGQGIQAQRLTKWLGEKRAEEEKELTFQPEIDSRSRRLCRRSENTDHVPKDAWFQRLSARKNVEVDASPQCSTKAPAAAKNPSRTGNVSLQIKATTQSVAKHGSTPRVSTSPSAARAALRPNDQDRHTRACSTDDIHRFHDARFTVDYVPSAALNQAGLGPEIRNREMLTAVAEASLRSLAVALKTSALKASETTQDSKNDIAGSHLNENSSLQERGGIECEEEDTKRHGTAPPAPEVRAACASAAALVAKAGLQALGRKYVAMTTLGAGDDSEDQRRPLANGQPLTSDTFRASLRQEGGDSNVAQACSQQANDAGQAGKSHCVANCMESYAKSLAGIHALPHGPQYTNRVGQTVDGTESQSRTSVAEACGNDALTSPRHKELEDNDLVQEELSKRQKKSGSRWKHTAPTAVPDAEVTKECNKCESSTDFPREE